TLLLRELARRSHPAPPRWAVAVAVVVFLTANPIPYTVNRPAIYEAAIIAGSCFLTAGLYLALRALGAASARARGGWLAASSVAFGLGAGSRVSLLPAAALLIALAAIGCWRAGRQAGGTAAAAGPHRRWLRLGGAAALAGGPAALIMGAHF